MSNVKLSSLPTIKRLPSYLHVIEAAYRDGKEYISGTVIAEELELEPIQVRKDLALTGIVGKPRLGFPVSRLIDAINGFLDWNSIHQAIVIGSGNLGTALMGYPEFTRHGMQIIAAFDSDTNRIGSVFSGIQILDILNLEDFIQAHSIEIAILTVPGDQAQMLAEKLVLAGIRAIWNFTNIKLKVPKDVVVQKEDLSSGYAVLSVKMARFKTGSNNANK
jgi:redox-sensing transcriptional repressor